MGRSVLPLLSLLSLLSSSFLVSGEGEKEAISKLSHCVSSKAPALRSSFAGHFLFTPTTSLEIQTIISCANSVDSEGDVRVRVAVKGSGLSNEGYGNVELEKDATTTTNIYVQIDLALLSKMVDFNHQEKTITVQAGMRLADFHATVLRASRNNLFSGVGLGGAVGSVGGVSVGGYVLCGGYGMLGRTFGVSSDQVVEMVVVLPGGEVMTASEEKNEGLFWALRGGCSSVFGVVVEVTVRLYEGEGLVTVVDLPPVVGQEKVVRVMEWFENYAPTASLLLSSSSSLTKEGKWESTFMYLGNSMEAKQATLSDFKRGFTGIFDENMIQNAYEERSFSSLIPEPQDQQQPKCSSSLLFSQMGEKTIQRLLEFSEENSMDTHWLAFGKENELAAGKGPLVRGQLFEVIFCLEEASDMKFREAHYHFVRSFKSSPNYLSKSWSHQEAGVAIFGKENLEKIRFVRKYYNTNALEENVLVSEGSRLMYPYTKPFVYVGCESVNVTVWSMDVSGAFKYLSNFPAPLPSWLDFFPRRDALLASSESSDFEGTSFGGLYTLRTNPDGTLSYISSSPSYSRAPDHSSVGPVGGTYAYAAHCCGNTTLFSVDKDYVLSAESLQNSTHPGVVTDPSTCDAGEQYVDGVLPFLHEVVPHPFLPYVFVNDLNSDKTYTYDVQTNDGLFQPNQPAHSLDYPIKTGPRHMAIHPFLPYIVLLGEKSQNVSLIYVDEFNGQLSIIESLTALSPSQLSTPGGFKGGEIAIHPNGKFVYCSNRDAGNPDTHRSSLTVFSFDPNAAPGSMLTQIQNLPSGGDHPRHFSLTPDGTRLLCAHQFTDNLVTFTVDGNTGLLKEIISTKTSPGYQPAYIRMVDVMVE